MKQILLPLVMLGCLAVQPSWASHPDFHLQVIPAIVYKVDDPGNTKTSSFVFDLAVICSTDCALTPISARVELSSAGSIVQRQDWTTEMLAKIKGVNYRIQPDTPVSSPRRMITLYSELPWSMMTQFPAFAMIGSCSALYRAGSFPG